MFTKGSQNPHEKALKKCIELRPRRTMLSDGPVDHAHLYRGHPKGEEGDNATASKFHFTFE